MKNILPYLALACISISLLSCEKTEAKKEEIPVAKDSSNIACDCPLDSLKKDLILYMPFSNSANDESGKKNHGKMYDISSVPDRYGKLNSAFYFNGKSSFITVEDNKDLRLSNTDFTINYWATLDEYYPLSGSAIFSKNNGAYQNGWNCSITGLGFVEGKVGRAFYNVSGGTDPYVVGNKVLDLSKWHMITITYTLASKEMKFYINGLLDQTSYNIPSPNPLTDVTLHIGKNSFNDPRGTTPSYFVKGKLDDMLIYRRKLKEFEIKSLYTSDK
jgi:hypothetical protein